MKEELLSETFKTEKTTDGPLKRAVESDIYSMIKDLGSGFKYGITLVGHPYGSDFNNEKNEYANIRRHIHDFKKIGIDSDNLFVVEQNEDIYKELMQMKYKYHLRCKIRFGDFYEVLKDLLSNGYKFKFVDFDGTEKYSMSLLKLINLYSKNVNNIGSLRILASPRGLMGKEKEALLGTAKEMGLEYNYRDSPMTIRDGLMAAILNSKNIDEEEKQRIKRNKGSITIVRKAPPLGDDIVYQYSLDKGLKCEVFTYSGDLNAKMTNFLISKSDLSNVRNYNYGFDKNSRKITVMGNTIEVLLPPHDSSTRSAYYLINDKIYYKRWGIEKFICNFKESK